MDYCCDGGVNYRVLFIAVIILCMLKHIFVNCLGPPGREKQKITYHCISFIRYMEQDAL